MMCRKLSKAVVGKWWGNRWPVRGPSIADVQHDVNRNGLCCKNPVGSREGLIAPAVHA